MGTAEPQVVPERLIRIRCERCGNTDPDTFTAAYPQIISAKLRSLENGGVAFDDINQQAMDDDFTPTTWGKPRFICTTCWADSTQEPGVKADSDLREQACQDLWEGG